LLKAASQVKSSGGVASGGGEGGGDNPVRAAYITSLESQLASVREELASLYKTQGQNAQRLLVMTDALREREDKSREETEDLRVLRVEYNSLRNKVDDLQKGIQAKETYIQQQQDELATANLEVDQLISRNKNLQEDNASLLKRWLDKVNDDAMKINDANLFLEEASKLKGKQPAIQQPEGTAVES